MCPCSSIFVFLVSRLAYLYIAKFQILGGGMEERGRGAHKEAGNGSTQPDPGGRLMGYAQGLKRTET